MYTLWQVRLGAVEPSAAATVASIRSLKPYSMSWSNVCDYIEPETFHTMARACSAPEQTVHFLHSMNWIQDVKGAFYMDHQFASTQGSQLRQASAYGFS